MTLANGERIITAWAEGASGHGWSNQPFWVLIQEGDGDLRLDCLQPDEHTELIMSLYDISESVHLAMTAAAVKAIPLRKENPE